MTKIELDIIFNKKNKINNIVTFKDIYLARLL